jgi:hypothetical protein
MKKLLRVAASRMASWILRDKSLRFKRLPHAPEAGIRADAGGFVEGER